MKSLSFKKWNRKIKKYENNIEKTQENREMVTEIFRKKNKKT